MIYKVSSLSTLLEQKLRVIFSPSEWDTISYLMYCIPSVIGPVAQFYAYKGTAGALTELTRVYCHHPSLCPQNQGELYSKVWWRVIGDNSIGFLSRNQPQLPRTLPICI